MAAARLQLVKKKLSYRWQKRATHLCKCNGVTDSLNTLLPKCVTESNLVTLGQAVWVYIKDPNFCDSGVRRRVRYRDRDVAACPCTNTPASKCVTEPNLVALHPTIWVYVGYCRVPKISGILGPAPLRWWCGWPPGNTPLPTCYWIEFCRSSSNGTSVIMGRVKNLMVRMFSVTFHVLLSTYFSNSGSSVN